MFSALPLKKSLRRPFIFKMFQLRFKCPFCSFTRHKVAQQFVTALFPRLSFFFSPPSSKPRRWSHIFRFFCSVPGVISAGRITPGKLIGRVSLSILRLELPGSREVEPSNGAPILSPPTQKPIICRLSDKSSVHGVNQPSALARKTVREDLVHYLGRRGRFWRTLKMQKEATPPFNPRTESPLPRCHKGAMLKSVRE